MLENSRGSNRATTERVRLSEAPTEDEGPGESNPRRATRSITSTTHESLTEFREAEGPAERRQAGSPTERRQAERPAELRPSRGPALIHAPLSAFYDSRGPGERERPRDQPAARLARIAYQILLPDTVIYMRPARCWRYDYPTCER
jgi:hypothetical protein